MCCLVQIHICIDDFTLRNVTLRLTLRPGAKCHTFRTYKKRIQIFAFGAAKAAWACSYDRICEIFGTRTGDVCTHLKIDDRFCAGFQIKNVIMQKLILKPIRTTNVDRYVQKHHGFGSKMANRDLHSKTMATTTSIDSISQIFGWQPPFERRPAESPASLLSNSQFCFTTFPRTA